MKKFLKIVDYVMAIVLVIGIVGLINSLIQLPLSKKAAPTLEDRIRELTQSLNKSATTIQEIENEMTKRQALVSQLQKDADTA